MAAASSSKHHDVIIIGAGFNGLVAAKTYLQVKPSVDILIIDDRADVGGVWSKERLYPGLFYEMPAPLLNFTDFDMCKELGVELWEDVSGVQVNDFLVCSCSSNFGLSHHRSRCDMLKSMISLVDADWARKRYPLRGPRLAGTSSFGQRTMQTSSLSLRV
jgi:hypothetical protein